jgi:hypothetical protein
MIDTKEIQKRYLDLLQRLIAEMNPEGYWAGRLSTSALSTAVAITALKLTDSEVDTNKIRNGLEWLYNNINKDELWRHAIIRKQCEYNVAFLCSNQFLSGEQQRAATAAGDGKVARC